MIVPDLLIKKADQFKDAPALVVDRGTGPVLSEKDEHGAMSFADWNRRSDSLAASLVESGVGPGDRVGIGFQNFDADKFCVTYFGILKAGGVAVPLGARLVEEEIGHILRHAEPRVVVGDSKRVAQVDKLNIPGIKLMGPDDYERAIAKNAASPRVARTESDLCDILYTSGTTGAPKGVASTHGNAVHLANTALAAFKGRAFLHAMPMWTFAGTHAMQFLPLRAGMRAVVMHKFEAERYMALSQKHEATASYTVPAMLKLCIDAFDAAPADKKPVMASTWILMFGSALTPPSTIVRLPDLFPSAMLVNTYGQTETGGGGCAMTIPPREAAKRPGSIGQPMPPTEIRIVVEEENGNTHEAAIGEIGEIWMKPPGGSRSYYKDPEATAKTFLEGGWVRTGDLGHWDEDKYLYLDDRIKDLVIRGGLNIFTTELDALLESHPAVQEAAVVGIAHPVLGEDLKACVVLRAGHSADTDTLRAFLLQRLADYKVPRTFQFYESLPRNAMGKIVKRQLRDA